MCPPGGSGPTQIRAQIGFEFPVSDPGSPRETPIWALFGSHGKIAQNKPRLPKFARFQCQILALNGLGIEDLSAMGFCPSDPRIGRKNADMRIFFSGVSIYIGQIEERSPSESRRGEKREGNRES